MLRIRSLPRHWQWVAGLVIAVLIAVVWLIAGAPKRIGAAAPLSPTEAPYYNPAPVTQLGPGRKQFELYATDGLQPLPGGGSMYIWGYSSENRRGSAKLPGPTMVVDEGDQVDIVLNNLGTANQDVLSMAHTIHLHGLDVPESTDGVLKVVQPGESFTYTFTATHPGTYWYHCHVDTIQHLTMGMYGTIVVRARGGAPQAWTKGPAYDREYTMLLSEADPTWNSAVEHGAAFDRTNYRPSYFFINGRSFPDTMNDPADLIHGKKGERVLVRLVNAGYTWKSMHMHGFHFDVIASDGRPLPQPESKDTISIGPGERYDLLVTFDQTGTYPFHSHAIVDNLNSGRYPGGIHTMVQVDDGKSPAPASHTDHGGAAPLPGDLSGVSYLKVGESRAHVHGTPLVLTARPDVANGVLLAPADFVAKALGATLTLDLAAETATFQHGQQRVQMTAQRSTAVTEKGEFPVPVAPRKAGQIMLVPVQPLADYFGEKAAFTADAGELLIGPAAADALKASRSLLQPPGLAGPKLTALPASPAAAPAAPAPAAAPPKQDPPPAAGAAAGATKNVVIHSLMFDPPEVQVKAGTTVAWLNADSLAHAVATPTNAFGDGHIESGHKYEFTFPEPGTYEYYCSIHPEMKGTIVVTR